TNGQSARLHGQLDVVAAQIGRASCREGAYGPVGHGAHDQTVNVQIADRAAVVGGDGGHVVIGYVEVHRAAAQELQAGARNNACCCLGHSAYDIQGQVASARAHGLTNRQAARLHGQLDVVAA